MAKISIIIPVYNVNDYIDECMDSIQRQTFEDFEVILINDGSTDGTEIKCEKWQKTDKRIRYYSKKNEGLSPTRNMGIDLAIGDYITFIDPDDWVDVTFLEKLYNKALESGAGIVECDIFRYNNNTGKQTYKISSGSIGIREDLEAHMIYGNTTLCKCLIHRSLFSEYKVYFPECHSPARGIYALLLALSGKVENVNEGLYFYRIFRKGSLTEVPRENIEDTEIGIMAFAFLLQEFKRCNLYEKYKQVLERSVKYKLSDLLATFYHRYKLVDYKKMKGSYKEYIKETFPISECSEYVTLGGYNLNRVVWNLNLLHDPYCRFNFSSIISIMNPVCKTMDIKHKNNYRDIMINRDVNSVFWDVIEEMQPKYLFFDFIEERFDILKYNEGYITKSDAWDELNFENNDIHFLRRDSEECRELWEESCIQFIDKMKATSSNTQLVLIKNYLSVSYGNIKEQKKYEQEQEINRVNEYLSHCYHFFEDNCSDVISVEVKDMEYYFTDEKFIYGTIPSHLNDIVNREMAKKIEEKIGLNQ